MAERSEVRKVEPPYLLEFIDLADVGPTVSNDEVSQFAHAKTASYLDDLTGSDRLLVIRSNDRRLVEDMYQAASKMGNEPKTEEQIRQKLSMYSTRLPIAGISYGERGSRIDCEESSCRYHVGGGCTNEDVMIQDDCGDAQYCMTYEPDDRNN